MSILRLNCFFLLISIIFSCCFNSYAKKQNYSFTHLKIEDGLSQSSISAIIQDSKGLMWFGTGNGLNKYDGYSFTVYTNKTYDSTTISANSITAIYEDKDGTIWIGTTDGILNKYVRKEESFRHYEIAKNLEIQSFSEKEFYEYPISFSRNNNSTITSITEDGNGNLWIGTWGKGLIKFNKKSRQKEYFYYSPTDSQSLSFNRVMNVTVDKRGKIWIGTFGGGLNKLFVNKNNEIKFEHYHINSIANNSISDEKIICLYEDKYNSLWIGTYDGGLNKLSLDQQSLPAAMANFVHYKHEPGNDKSLSNNTVMAIIQDYDGYLWAGTFGGGLDRFDYATNSFISFKNDPLDENTITDNDVLSLCVDKSGIIWVGTHLGEGISKLEKNKMKFNLLQHEPGKENTLIDQVVWSIYTDSTNILWIGTYRGGLNKYDRTKNKFTHYTFDLSVPNSISDNHIRSIVKDKNGYLWIGTYSGGLNKFDPSGNKFIRYKNNPNDPNSIGSNQIQDICIDEDSVFWLGTFGGGLNKFSLRDNSGKINFTRYTHNPENPMSISDNRVYSIFEGKDGSLWLGTFGGGLNHFDKKTETFVSYRNKPRDPTTLSEDRILSVFEDSNENLWIGTYGGGLNKFDRNKNIFIHYSAINGLTSDVVYGILEDDDHKLWISTDNGLYRFDPKQDYFAHYDLQDGLQSLEFSGGAYFENYDGEMFFGGINGLNYFYPDSIFDNEYIPPIVITNTKVLNDPVKGEKDSLYLNYNENFISFEFAALDYTNPEDNQYAYKLEGLENEWNYTNADLRVANYTNLSPGEYVFRVRGSNNDGLWNTDGASIVITISPPFWYEWWFISLAILLVGSTIYFLSTIKIKNQLAMERLKTKLAADLHDNVGAGLTEISIMSELVTQDINKLSSASADKLQGISSLARQLVDNMSDIVWVVNPKRDSLYDLIIRLKDSYNDLFQSMGISFKTNNLEKLQDVKLSMDYRQHLYLMFKEAINNSVKHSRCTRLALEANIRSDVLEIVLRDNGIGMENTGSEFGNGLRNMENRARILGGRLKWKSSNNKGTLIQFVGRINSFSRIRTYTFNLFNKGIFKLL